MKDNMLDIEKLLLDKERNNEKFNLPYKFSLIHKETYDDRFIGSEYNWK